MLDPAYDDSPTVAEHRVGANPAPGFRASLQSPPRLSQDSLRRHTTPCTSHKRKSRTKRRA